jgi:dipeptidyl aminopeptidase/acylaminoacyl peptidase
MNFEKLARSAAAEVWAETERTLDVEARWRDLRRHRARGRVAWVAAAAAAAALVLLVVTAPWPHRRALPAVPPRPVPVESLLFQAGSGLTVLGGSSPPLHGNVKASVPSPMAFSPDGSTLAYGDKDVHVVDVNTGADRTLEACRQPSCPVAWSPDSKEVLTASPSALLHIPVAGGKASTHPLPQGWSVTGLDVNAAGQVALTGRASGEASVMTVDLTSGRAEVLFKFGPYADLGDPRWASDGQSIKYLQWRGLQDGHSNDLSVRSIRVDGQDLRVVAQLGRCDCFDPARPWMDLSPGGRLAVSTRNQGRARVVEVGADGRLTTLFSGADQGAPAGIGPVAWRSVPNPTPRR